MTSRLKMLLATMLLLAAGVEAKSYGSSGGGFSSRPSTSFSSRPAASFSKPSYSAPAPSFKTASSTFVPKPSAAPSPTVAPATQAPKALVPGKSTFVPAAVVATGVGVGAVAAVASAPKPAPSTAVDAKLAKNTALTGKTFTTKADAEVAYKNKLAAEATQYKSSVPPATRPSIVPAYVTSNGQHINVTYNHYGSGGYGYGYYSPTTHMFIALMAADMIMDSQRQADMNAQYQQSLILQQQQVLASQQAAVVQQNAYAAQQGAQAPVEGHSLWFWGVVVFVIVLVAWYVLF